MKRRRGTTRRPRVGAGSVPDLIRQARAAEDARQYRQDMVIALNLVRAQVLGDDAVVALADPAGVIRALAALGAELLGREFGSAGVADPLGGALKWIDFRVAQETGE